ncbi:hypothetical protein Tco_0716599, partial [Tanacetum coccineum]
DVYPVFVDLESSTQADRARSSQVPVPLPEDPYEAIRQAYLDGTDTESEPFEDLVETETPESPLTIAPPISLSECTPPILVPILCRTVCMTVRVPPVMSSGLSVSMAKVAAMSESAFRTSELVEDSEEDDEIEESMDFDSMSEDAKDEGPTAEDKDPATEHEGLAARVEGPGMDDKSYGLDDESRGLDDEGHGVESDGLGLEEEEEAVPEGQQQAAPIVGTAVSAPLGLGYGALRRQELALEEDHVYNTFEVGQGSGSAPETEIPERTPPSPEWTSGSLPISPSPFVVPSPVSSPLTEGLIRDHVVRLEELSLDLFERSLEYEQERVAVTFRALWRPMLALESWAGQTDAQRAALWHANSDMQGENQDLRLQLTEERHVRLELAEVVDGIRRGQEPRGYA